MHGLNYTTESSSEFRLVRCQGELTGPGALWLVAELTDSTETQSRNLLIDITRLSGELNTEERYRVGVAIAEQLLGWRIAILDQESRINKLAENTAFNRGAEILVTSDGEEARDWLRPRSARP